MLPESERDHLRLLGFNARQIAPRFSTSTGPQPFNAKAVGDFFADVPSETLLERQLALLMQVNLNQGGRRVSDRGEKYRC